MISPYLPTGQVSTLKFHDAQDMEIKVTDSYNEGPAVEKCYKAGKSHDNTGGGGASIFANGGEAGEASGTSGDNGNSGSKGSGGGGGVPPFAVVGSYWANGGDGGGASFQIFF